MKETLFRFNSGFLSARVGEWMYVVALNWIVLTETQSPWLLAVINACRLLPSLALSVPAGALADRKDPRRLSFFNNLANAVLMIAVGLALHFALPMPLVCVLVLGQAVLTALEAPFRNTYMNGLFEGVRLKQAIAQSASLMNLGRILGPAVAGFTLAYLGGLPTFVMGAFCTALFSLAISTLGSGSAVSPIAAKGPKPASVSLWQILRENREIREIMLLAAPMMFFGFPYTAMLSVLTDTMLGLGAEELGILTAVSAAGALAASSWLGLRPEHATWGATLRYAVLFALSLCLLGVVQGVASAAVVLFIVGYLGQAYRSCSRMHLHEVVPRATAGRVLGLSLMDRGMIPLGGLALGALTEFASARLSFAVMGAGCLISVAYFLPRWRRLMPKILLATGTCAVLALTLAGCSAPTPPASTASTPSGEKLTVEHVWGKTEVPKSPQRIVVLDLPFLDALTALGQPVVGYAGTSEKALPLYLAEPVKALGSEPTFVGERKQPNLEVLMSLKPDLIVASPERHNMIRTQLEALAPTVAFRDDSLSDVRQLAAELALITGKAQEKEVLEQKLAQRIASLKTALSGAPRVLVVGSFEDEFSTWTKSSFIGTLLEDVGANYAFDGPPTPSEGKAEVAKLTLESLTEIDPDYLFVYGDPSRWEQNPLYKKLKAGQDGKIAKVDRDLWARSRGPLAALAILDEYEKFLTPSP